MVEECAGGGQAGNARQAQGEWLLTVATGLDEVIALRSIQCELALREVYRKVTFPEDAGRRS